MYAGYGAGVLVTLVMLFAGASEWLMYAVLLILFSAMGAGGVVALMKTAEYGIRRSKYRNRPFALQRFCFSLTFISRLNIMKYNQEKQSYREMIMLTIHVVRQGDSIWQLARHMA